jgi:MFS family permease
MDRPDHDFVGHRRHAHRTDSHRPQFYAARFLLGLAEAGFFPGLLVYLTYGYRDEDRGKAIGMFMSATPVASTIDAPLSALLMRIRWFGLPVGVGC